VAAAALFQATKPYLLLAVAAFFAGFLSYVTVGAARSTAQAAPAQPVASAPAADDWNLPKKI
jgi:hypothetical protein